MNFLKKIGNLLSKMTSSRKNEKIVEALNQKAKPKEDPVQDIEDLIRTQYSSPLQTRSQRLKRTQIKAISSIAPETGAANLKLKPIQLLKSENLINTSRSVKAEVKHGIVPNVHSKVSETDAGQPLSLGLETVPGAVLPGFSHPVNETNKSQPLFESDLGKCVQLTSAASSESTDVESGSKKIDVKAARTAGKGKRSTKQTHTHTDDAEKKSTESASDKSPKAKSTRKTKASKEEVGASKEEKSIAKKKSPKKETKEKGVTEKVKVTSAVQQELMPIPSASVKPSKKALKLTSFQFNPHKINSNSTALKVEDDADDVKEESKRKRASPLKPREISDSEPEIKLEKWQPDKWPEALENIKLMRTFQEAPVDQMGCHKCCDENADEKTKRFQHLVALMLSSQTRDQLTYEVMQRLRENTCTPASIVQMNPEELMQILHPVSFYKSKTKYLQNTARILIAKYDSDIPKNVNELIKLPGVGPKMAHICMNVAWDMITGIGVDTHVHRISNRLGWVKNATKEPEQTRKQLEHWLPAEHWRDVNYLLVGFGQTLCTPVRPKCDKCLNNAFCPSANVAQTSPKKEIKIEKQEEF